MSGKKLIAIGISTAALVVLGAFGSNALSAPDKQAVKVPGGLGFAEFKGYESWQLVSISQNGKLVAAILGNPTIMDAFRAGIPANGKPFPDGSRMAKIHWVPKQKDDVPGPPTVPSVQHDVDFMVKDSARFGAVGGWGYAAFQYDAASDTFTPSTKEDHPPQANDAKCGVACHTKAKAHDFVFTEYAHR
ncbi:MAG TPA: cytochrome P460 family protein [Polyangia bacterium]|nr:cytochrome P460 family protein [Polyangia bacterium]